MEPRNKKPRVLMIVENCYERDSRVRKEAGSLKGSFDLTIISLRGQGEKKREKKDGIHHIRIPELDLKVSDHLRFPVLRSFLKKFKYIIEYSYLTIASLLIFLPLMAVKRFDVIHVHNPPDTFFMLGRVGKLLGARFVFDHHDLSPELYLAKFSEGKDLFYRTLLVFERLTCRLADVIIATNETYVALTSERHRIPRERYFVVRNDPFLNEKEFADKKPVNKNTCSVLYVGSINEQDGLEYLLFALDHVRKSEPLVSFHCTVAGDGDHLPVIKDLCRTLDLCDLFTFTGYIYDSNRIRDLLEMSDVCVEPAPSSPLNDRSTFIKIMEYMAAARPVVAFDLPETRYSLGEGGILVRPDDVKGFAEGLTTLLQDPDLRKQMGYLGYERVRGHLNWNSASETLLAAYSSMFSPTDTDSVAGKGSHVRKGS